MSEQQNTDERAADLERREVALRTDRVRFELTKELSAAKCRDEGLADAVAVMASTVTPTFDDDGRISELALGGKTYATVGEAAAAFLEARSYLVDTAAPAKRDGEPPKKLQKSPESLVSDAFATGKQPAVQPVPAKLPKGNLSELIERGYTPSDLASDGWANPPK